MNLEAGLVGVHFAEVIVNKAIIEIQFNSTSCMRHLVPFKITLMNLGHHPCFFDMPMWPPHTPLV